MKTIKDCLTKGNFDLDEHFVPGKCSTFDELDLEIHECLEMNKKNRKW